MECKRFVLSAAGDTPGPLKFMVMVHMEGWEEDGLSSTDSSTLLPSASPPLASDLTSFIVSWLQQEYSAEALNKK